jgi:hypothetical protein
VILGRDPQRRRPSDTYTTIQLFEHHHYDRGSADPVSDLLNPEATAERQRRTQRPPMPLTVHSTARPNGAGRPVARAALLVCCGHRTRRRARSQARELVTSTAHMRGSGAPQVRELNERPASEGVNVVCRPAHPAWMRRLMLLCR